jgi:hypothetical protein
MTATSLIQRNAYRLCSNFNSAFENGRRSSLHCFGLAKAAVAPVLLSNLHFKSLWKRIMSTDEAIADRSIMYEASWNSRYEGIVSHNIISHVMWCSILTEKTFFTALYRTPSV